MKRIDGLRTIGKTIARRHSRTRDAEAATEARGVGYLRELQRVDVDGSMLARSNEDGILRPLFSAVETEARIATRARVFHSWAGKIGGLNAAHLGR